VVCHSITLRNAGRAIAIAPQQGAQRGHAQPRRRIKAVGLIKTLKQPTTRARSAANSKHQNEGLFRSRAFFQFCKNIVHVEAGRFLPLWIVLECHQEIAHVGLRGDKLEGVIQQPIIV
jgi:hypothetical protein